MAGFDQLVSQAASGRALPPGGYPVAKHGKLAYLLHLLANLSLPLLIVGPEGSGKTRLLRQAQSGALEGWVVCYIAASPNLSYERVLDEMREVLRKPGQESFPGSSEEFLSEQLQSFAKQGRSFILLIDQAGNLMPGLLGALAQLPGRLPRLRLAFSLRPEELAEKAASDGFALAEAHRLDLAVLPEPDASAPSETAVLRPLRSRPSAPATESLPSALAALWSKGKQSLLGRLSPGARPVLTLSAVAVAAALAAGLAVRSLWPKPSETAVPVILPAAAERLHESPKTPPVPVPTPPPATPDIPSAEPVTPPPAVLEKPVAPAVTAPSAIALPPPGPSPVSTAVPVQKAAPLPPAPVKAKAPPKPRPEKAKTKKPERKKQRQLVIDLDALEAPAGPAPAQ